MIAESRQAPKTPWIQPELIIEYAILSRMWSAFKYR